MLRNFLKALTGPTPLLACALAAVAYVALNPPRAPTPHEWYVRALDPRRSVAEERRLTRPHRVACPICRGAEAMLTLCKTHDGAERDRILRGLHDHRERPFDHVRRCPLCRDRPIP